VSLVLDLRIVHDRFGSIPDPSRNGFLHYHTDIDRSLNETDSDKIRKYLVDFNNNPLIYIHKKRQLFTMNQETRAEDKTYI
jgi:hypothetical protein